ncbi:MAG: hypothetical protein A3C11_03015 [Candidatus Sungbacteria bacterium RIFCSPHIGHO2_02_FULL_49_12]|uniref:Uncharacterized protein n=1 Tax=Candidatus Sungbacteria bacterium RIFCSPHIGHO2_02_FULL_49_12 TaxID=1802271 RepID=A0A1G2KNV1_9BACT|nr:MAG: hypothetical protein A3C11_03015 [Candidatus Sungbacteria bacterium RIFCSPHIGHO2_02_FULL_49_12]
MPLCQSRRSEEFAELFCFCEESFPSLVALEKHIVAEGDGHAYDQARMIRVAYARRNAATPTRR